MTASASTKICGPWPFGVRDPASAAHAEGTGQHRPLRPAWGPLLVAPALHHATSCSQPRSALLCFCPAAARGGSCAPLQALKIIMVIKKTKTTPESKPISKQLVKLFLFLFACYRAVPSLQHTERFVCRGATPAVSEPVPVGAAATVPRHSGARWCRGGSAERGQPRPQRSGRRRPLPAPAEGTSRADSRSPQPSAPPPRGAGLASSRRRCLPVGWRLATKERSGCGRCRSGVAVGRPW